MAQIITPGRWNAQPQGPVAVRAEILSPQSQILLPSAGIVNYLEGDTYTSSAPLIESEYGLCYSSDSGSVALPSSTDVTTPRTLAYIVRGPHSLVSWPQVSTNNGLQLYNGVEWKYRLYVYDNWRGGSWVSAWSVSSYATDTWLRIVIVTDHEGKIKVYINGIPEIEIITLGGIGTDTVSKLSITGYEAGSPMSVALGIRTKTLWNISAARKFSENPWQIFNPPKRQFWPQVINLLNPRYARPITTISNTGWSASTGSDLPAMINEETPNDTDYIYSNTYAAVYEGKLEPVEDPNTSSAQVIKYRTRSLYGNTLIAKLKQGGTVIATRTHTNVPAEWTQYSMILTEAEADSITDYTDLRVHTEIG
jgi:hypothetical protein